MMVMDIHLTRYVIVVGLNMALRMMIKGSPLSHTGRNGLKVEARILEEKRQKTGQLKKLENSY